MRPSPLNNSHQSHSNSIHHKPNPIFSRVNIKKTFSTSTDSVQLQFYSPCWDKSGIHHSKRLNLSASFTKNSRNQLQKKKQLQHMSAGILPIVIDMAKNDTKINSSSARQSPQLQVWQCPNSHKTECQSCLICRGTKKTSEDSPIIKFFLFVLDYKLKPHQKPQNVQKTSHKQVTTKKQQNFRYRLSTSSTLQTRAQITHFGYYCNGCGMEQPIKGVRYHCLWCADYDLCGYCFQKSGHQHRMERVEMPESFRRAAKIVENMQQRINLTSSLGEASYRLLRLQKQMLRKSAK